MLSLCGQRFKLWIVCRVRMVVLNELSNERDDIFPRSSEDSLSRETCTSASLSSRWGFAQRADRLHALDLIAIARATHRMVPYFRDEPFVADCFNLLASKPCLHLLRRLHP